MKRRCVIVGGAGIRNYQVIWDYLNPDDFNIFCDSGLHHLDAFPIDTHIHQVLKAHYKKGFPKRRYKGCRGVLQQYLFYYSLFHTL